MAWQKIQVYFAISPSKIQDRKLLNPIRHRREKLSKGGSPMWRRGLCLAVLLAALPLWGVPAQAGQRLVTLPGGLRQVQVQELDRQLGTPVQWMAVTQLPADTVAYLDGRPLALGQRLDRAEVDRLYLFSPRERLWMGVLAVPESAPRSSGLRIRCINPAF